MSRILVDSSIWIDYFRDKRKYTILDELIANNQICVNDVILSELLPFLYHLDQKEVVEALLAMPKADINVDWDALIHFQTANLLRGIHRVGIPDLMILQNVLDHHLVLFSADRHFRLMSQIFDFRLFKDTSTG